jgi:hypothetical protein
MRDIVVAKLLSLALLVLYLVIGLTLPPSEGREASRITTTTRCG